MIDYSIKREKTKLVINLFFFSAYSGLTFFSVYFVLGRLKFNFFFLRDVFQIVHSVELHSSIHVPKVVP